MPRFGTAIHHGSPRMGRIYSTRLLYHAPSNLPSQILLFAETLCSRRRTNSGLQVDRRNLVSLNLFGLQSSLIQPSLPLSSFWNLGIIVTRHVYLHEQEFSAVPLFFSAFHLLPIYSLTSNMSQLSEAQTRIYLAFLQSLSLDDPSLKVSIY